MRKKQIYLTIKKKKTLVSIIVIFIFISVFIVNIIYMNA